MGLNFKVNEIFFSIQGEGRGPIRDRLPKEGGAGAQRSALCDLGGVYGVAVGERCW